MDIEMSDSKNDKELLKVKFSAFQTKMIVRGILSLALFVAALLSMNDNTFGSEKFFNVLLFISPIAMVWISADTILITLLKRRHQPPIFILLYKPYLSENKKRSTIKELAILSWIIGHLLSSSLGTIVEFYTLLVFFTGLHGMGNSLALYYSAKFDFEEQLLKSVNDSIL